MQHTAYLRIGAHVVECKQHDQLPWHCKEAHAMIYGSQIPSFEAEQRYNVVIAFAARILPSKYLNTNVTGEPVFFYRRTSGANFHGLDLCSCCQADEFQIRVIERRYKTLYHT